MMVFTITLVPTSITLIVEHYSERNRGRLNMEMVMCLCQRRFSNIKGFGVV